MVTWSKTPFGVVTRVLINAMLRGVDFTVVAEADQAGDYLETLIVFHWRGSNLVDEHRFIGLTDWEIYTITHIVPNKYKEFE